jgi:hypothetical protein
MKKFITIILLFLVVVASAQDYKALIKDAPGKDKYPDASALNIFTKVDITVNADGSSSRHVYYIKEILTYKGKTRYSDVKITYNANFETVKIGHCFTVKDGKEVPLPKEAIHDNATYLTMYSPEYINQKQTVVNLPSVEPGSFVIMDYTIETKGKDYFSGVEHFQEENPYLHKEMHITMPKAMPLFYQFDADKVKFEKKDTKDAVVYSWTANDVPLIKDERNKPSYLIIGRPVFYSSVDSWKNAIPKLFAQFNATNYKVKAVTDLAKEITKGKTSEQEKIYALYNYIHDNFEFKYSMSDDKFTLQDPQKILNQRYGSNKELTALFIAMANSVGVAVKPVFVLGQTRVKSLQTLPCRDYVSGINVYYNKTLLTFDQKDAAFGFAWYTKALLFTNDKPMQTINYTFDTHKLITKTVTVSLNDDFSANASFDKVLRGSEDFFIRNQFKNETEKNRKIWFSRNLSDKSISITDGPEFVNIKDYEKNTEIKFKAHLEAFYTKQDNYFYMALPETQPVDITLTGKERENPYQVGSAVSFFETYVFENLPQGYTVIKPQQPIEETLKTGNSEMRFSVKAELKGNKLTVTREVYIPSCIVAKADYLKFYQFVANAQKPLNSLIFLKKK